MEIYGILNREAPPLRQKLLLWHWSQFMEFYGIPLNSMDFHESHGIP